MPMFKKWFPGHYLSAEPDNVTGTHKAFTRLAGPDGDLFTGLFMYKTWSTMEPTFRAWDWSSVYAILDWLPPGKKAALSLAWQSWSSNLVPVPCPADTLIAGPIFDGGYRTAARPAGDIPFATMHMPAMMDRYLEFAQAFADEFDADERLAWIYTAEIAYDAQVRTGPHYVAATAAEQWLKLSREFPKLFTRTVAGSLGAFWPHGNATANTAQFAQNIYNAGGSFVIPDLAIPGQAPYDSNFRPEISNRVGMWAAGAGMEWDGYLARAATIAGTYATLSELQAAFPSGNLNSYWVGSTIHYYAAGAWRPMGNPYGRVPWPNTAIDQANALQLNIMWWNTGERQTSSPQAPNGVGGYGLDAHVIPYLRSNPGAGITTVVPQNLSSPGLIFERTGRALPAGLFDVTQFPGLTTEAARTGLVDVTRALRAAIDYCITNDLTACQPHSTRFMVLDTIPMIDRDVTGNQTSPGAPGYVGEQGGALPEIFLGPGAEGFNDALRPKILIHILRLGASGSPPVSIPKDTPYPVDPQATPLPEDANSLFSGYLGGIRITGSGYPGCDLLCFDSAQSSVACDLVLDGQAGLGGNGCRVAITGIPGRSMESRNITTIGCQYALRTQHTYFPGAVTCVGATLVNFVAINPTVTAIYNTAVRGALKITGLKIIMPAGAVSAISTYGSISGEAGTLHLVDAVIDMASPSSNAIIADDASVSLTRVYARNCAQVVSEVTATIPSLAGNATGTTYVTQYVNTPPRSGSTSGKVMHYWIQGASRPDLAPNVVSTVAGLPDDKFVTKHFYREPWCMDSSRVILATDVTTTPAVVPNATSTGTVDNLAGLAAKQAEANAAGKWLYLPKGWYKVGGTVNLGTDGKLLGMPRNSSIISPSAALLTQQSAPGAAPVALVASAQAAQGTASMMHVCVDAYQRVNSWGLVEGVWIRNGRGRWQHLSMQAGMGFARYPAVLMRIIGDANTEVGPWGTGSGGGIVGSIRADAAVNLPEVGRVSLQHQRLRAVGVTLPLDINFNPEWGGAPERTPQHAPLMTFKDCTRVRLGPIKSEGLQTLVELINTKARVGVLAVHRVVGPSPLPSYIATTVVGPAVTVDATSEVEIHGVSVGVTNPSMSAETVPIVADGQPGTPLLGNAYMAYYLKGAPPSIDSWDSLVSDGPQGMPNVSFLAGVARGNISSVNGVALANIASIHGV
jgi:hypothetical protein